MMFLTPKCGLSLIAFLLLGLSRAHDDVGVVQVSVNSDRRQAAFGANLVSSNFAFPGKNGFYFQDGHTAQSCATECGESGSTYFQLRKAPAVRAGNCGCTRKGVQLSQKVRNNDFDIYEIVEREPTTTQATYKMSDKNVDACGGGLAVVDTSKECKTAAEALGREWVRENSWQTGPFGCFDNKDGKVFFNTFVGGPANPNRALVCKQAPCERPSGWCTHNRATYDDFEDCDGDGVADPQCESMATTGESGFIASSNNCGDTWGRGNNIENCK